MIVLTGAKFHGNSLPLHRETDTQMTITITIELTLSMTLTETEQTNLISIFIQILIIDNQSKPYHIYIIRYEPKKLL